ncbi:MAG: hypothetical protein R8K22_02480 [Mariprofundaceae bacterium]
MHTSSLFSYRGPVREALLAWKLGHDDAAMRWLLETAKSRLQEIFTPHDLLLPVPMPLSRMRKSGQHHTADLCKQISMLTGCRWHWQLLRRNGEQYRQSELSGRARRKNLRKAFQVNLDHLADLDHSQFQKTRIWVVDDILTTGATLHHASKALCMLKQPIRAFSLARTLKER